MQKVGEKLFFQYRKIEDNDENHTIDNLSKNQFYFQDPTKFNDPFDCKVFLDRKGTEADWISWFERVHGYDRPEAIEILYKSNAFKKEGDLFTLDPDGKIHRQIGIKLHEDINKEALSRVCCFSETDESIRMWSHYADSHHGICLRFRSFIDPFNLHRIDYFLPLYKTSQSAPTYSPFIKVNYTDEILEPVSFFDSNRIEKMPQFLFRKSSDWSYEQEYRMLLNKDELQDGIINYDKEDLEGIVFGLRINYQNAKPVYDTIKRNYLDDNIGVNFYKATEVPRKNAIDIVRINDVEKFISNLL